MKHKITITITVGKAISPEDEVQSIHFNVTTPARKMTWILKTAKTMIYGSI